MFSLLRDKHFNLITVRKCLSVLEGKKNVVFLGVEQILFSCGIIGKRHFRAVLLKNTNQNIPSVKINNKITVVEHLYGSH